MVILETINCSVLSSMIWIAFLLAPFQYSIHVQVSIRKAMRISPGLALERRKVRIAPCR